MNNDVKIAQLLNSRICHDLSGAIGSMDHCLGLIDSNDQKIKDEAKELASQESFNLFSRIRFFKLAYGDSDEEELSIIKIIKLITDFLNSYDIDFELQSKKHGILYLESNLKKLLLVLIHILSDYTGTVGKMRINFSGKNDKVNIVIESEGTRNLARVKENFDQIKGKDIADFIKVDNCREYYAEILLTTINYQKQLTLIDDNKLRCEINYQTS